MQCDIARTLDSGSQRPNPTSFGCARSKLKAISIDQSSIARVCVLVESLLQSCPAELSICDRLSASLAASVTKICQRALRPLKATIAIEMVVATPSLMTCIRSCWFAT